MSPQRRQILELTVQAVQLLHYGTFLCSNLEKILTRYDFFKATMKEFKQANIDQLNKVDVLYLGYLYKIPKLVLIKRGFLEELKQIQLLKENKNNEESILPDNDPV